MALPSAGNVKIGVFVVVPENATSVELIVEAGLLAASLYSKMYEYNVPSTKSTAGTTLSITPCNARFDILPKSKEYTPASKTVLENVIILDVTLSFAPRQAEVGATRSLTVPGKARSNQLKRDL